jgi:putative glycosyltransferase
MTRVKLSIVTTLYQSAAFVTEFYRRTCAAAEAVTRDFEIVFVDDGSPDNSVDLATELYARDPRVRIVTLSRNFGHHKAMMTGLAHARGDLVFLIDSDLEIEPEVLPSFAERLRESHADVVYGVQDKRQDGAVDRLASTLFYATFNRLSRYSLPYNVTSARLMTSRYVAALLRHREQEFIIAGLWVITGFTQLPLAVRKTKSRKSTYSWGRKIAVLINAVTSFSDRPLVAIFYAGSAISLLAGLIATSLVGRRLLFHTIAPGWLSLIVSTWLLGGIIIFCLGIIGIYLSKIFLETKNRPYTIVKEIHEHHVDE